MAAHYPERLVSLQKGGAIDEILEITERGSISRIDGPVVERGSVGASLLGGFLGFSVGVVPALGGASEGVAWLLLAGSVAVGAYLGHYRSRHTTDGLVYQAIQ